MMPGFFKVNARLKTLAGISDGPSTLTASCKTRTKIDDSVFFLISGTILVYSNSIHTKGRGIKLTWFAFEMIAAVKGHGILN